MSTAGSAPARDAAAISPAAAPATAARCRIYHQFARAFMHPDAAHDQHAGDGTWQRRLRSLARQLPYADPFTSIRDPGSNAVAGLGEIYTSTFDVGQGALSLYGRTYLGREDKPLFEELFRFYEHFGLVFDGGMPAWPDWMVIELEFMHYLSFLEAEASAGPSCVPLRRAERDFIDRQLLEFTAGLATALKDRAVPVYAELAQLLHAFVSSDLTYLRQAATCPAGNAVRVRPRG